MVLRLVAQSVNFFEAFNRPGLAENPDRICEFRFAPCVGRQERFDCPNVLMHANVMKARPASLKKRSHARVYAPIPRWFAAIFIIPFVRIDVLLQSPCELSRKADPFGERPLPRLDRARYHAVESLPDVLLQAG